MLVPPLTRCFEGKQIDGARRLASGFLGAIVLTFLVVAGLFALGAPLVVTVITGAVHDPDIREWQLRIGCPLLIMLMPQLLLYGIVTAAIAVQNAQRRFALAAAAPAFENTGTIVLMLLSAGIFGVGTHVNEVMPSHLLFLGLGSTVIVGLHAGIQWWGAYRLGIPLVPWLRWSDAEVRSILRKVVPASIYTGLGSMSYLAMLVVAGSLPGGAVAFQIGYNFFNLPIALCARPVAAAQLPLLSRSFDRGDNAGFAALYRAGLQFTIFFALPASVLLFSIREALGKAVSFGEMSEPAGIELVSIAIGSLALGTVGEALFIVSTSASFARRDAMMPLKAMIVRAGASFGGIGIALYGVEGTVVLWVLGLSSAAASLLGAFFLHLKLRGVLPPPTGLSFCSLARLCAASAAAAALGVLVVHWLSNARQASYQELGVALAATLVGGTGYLIVQWCSGSEEMSQLLSGIPRRDRRRRIPGPEDHADLGARNRKGKN
jgi:putative peptidoglycan lipid II flippase